MNDTAGWKTHIKTFLQEQAEKWRKETSEGDRVDESGLVSHEGFYVYPSMKGVQ